VVVRDVEPFRLPILVGVDELVVNTKNWYMKGTDLWAEFGKEAPFDREFSSKDLVKKLAVGSTSSFGRRAACA
jgi:hypothetical protein